MKRDLWLLFAGTICGIVTTVVAELILSEFGLDPKESIHTTIIDRSSKNGGIRYSDKSLKFQDIDVRIFDERRWTFIPPFTYKENVYCSECKSKMIMNKIWNTVGLATNIFMAIQMLFLEVQHFSRILLVMMHWHLTSR